MLGAGRTHGIILKLHCSTQSASIERGPNWSRPGETHSVHPSSAHSISDLRLVKLAVKLSLLIFNSV